jgi:hypothetical protein
MGEGGGEEVRIGPVPEVLSNKDLMRIKNPLDQILQKEGGGNP